MSFSCLVFPGCFPPLLLQQRSGYPLCWAHRTQIFPKGIQMPSSLQCKLSPSWRAWGYGPLCIPPPAFSNSKILSPRGICPSSPRGFGELWAVLLQIWRKGKQLGTLSVAGYRAGQWLQCQRTYRGLVGDLPDGAPSLQLLGSRLSGLLKTGTYPWLVPAKPLLLQLYFKRRSDSSILWRSCPGR